MNGPKLIRSWRQIAAEVAQETDPEKLNKLTDELLRAMEEESRQAFERLQFAMRPPQKARVSATFPSTANRRRYRRESPPRKCECRFSTPDSS